MEQSNCLVTGSPSYGHCLLGANEKNDVEKLHLFAIEADNKNPSRTTLFTLKLQLLFIRVSDRDVDHFLFYVIRHESIKCGDVMESLRVFRLVIQALLDG
ncbi:hypothetical protein PsorP6_004682 [Peronosclerospora sorghi]|uniref:Uncharacterized protein n=1 Tax=Peronosclerospora sorghi TaxID=230839 RepID=A0ACC0VPJ5_9STRA|nr:hypothetical protein PsorP6_004682 [Peronosclerospora sorghi]